MAVRRLIRYAGYEPPTCACHRRIPVERAMELRGQGLGWKEVTDQITIEHNSHDMPFTVGGVQAAILRAKKKEKASAE